MHWLKRTYTLRYFVLFCLYACATSTAHHAAPVNAPSAAAAAIPAHSCLSPSVRTRIVELADPNNFVGARYRKGPGSRENPELETDCSSFVYEIYRRAGLPYAFHSSRELLKAEEFVKIRESEALPGDLMVFRGHVGIIGEDGRIISATRNRKGRSPSSITRMARTKFHSRRNVLRYRCPEGAAP